MCLVVKIVIAATVDTVITLDSSFLLFIFISSPTQPIHSLPFLPPSSKSHNRTGQTRLYSGTLAPLLERILGVIEVRSYMAQQLPRSTIWTRLRSWENSVRKPQLYANWRIPHPNLLRSHRPLHPLQNSSG